MMITEPFEHRSELARRQPGVGGKRTRIVLVDMLGRCLTRNCQHQQRQYNKSQFGIENK
jgi:hypothetical protein